MSDESYWIERHTLASGRAKQAEQDRDLAREQRDGWIARAERAEAAEADLRATVERVRALAVNQLIANPVPMNQRVIGERVLAALDGPTDTEGADRG